MFNGFPSPVYVQALNNCSLAYFPKHCISETLARQPDFMHSMLRSMSGLMRELIGDLENCCPRNARQRLIHYLLRQAHSSAMPHVEIQLPSSKAAVASTLNLSAETFSRELHQLAREGLIAIDRRTIRLRDKKQLENLVRQF
jgi:CRP-like cAMP-binding protein